MLAVTAAASQAKKHGLGKIAVAVVLTPLLLVAVAVLAIVSDDEPAQAAGITGVTCAPASATAAGEVAGYGPDQMHNAAIIVGVGQQMTVPDRGWVVAIAAAMQESGLRNLDYGDRDSLGLFQERPSQGWGTPQQIMDPAYSARKFYEHLLGVPGWEQLSVNDAAQAVERSGFPDAYGRHEQDAREVVGAVQGVTCTGGHTNPKAQAVVQAALSQLGVPYAWGGGTAAGPSPGSGVDAGKVGFDCSGLAVYAYAQIGVTLPHNTTAIWSAFQPAVTSPADVLPGDLILLSDNGQPTGDIHHLGIYVGNGQVVQAPESGDVVKITNNVWHSPYWSSQFIGAVRPGTT
ncbi:NlpC/P60 family protein [Solihabitans fulvus]|uniref:NlpC/P60 family protein n=1 Tax=Solihabitans fulvus TaxID=1892852 RepID=A0A5B2W3M6_9PSEU|nr:NlpC/P60 family protein [Solihabitans fulvus]KAA2245945.1 NlpC/P60 family protein [Solihabitans fulvus]